MKFSPRKFTLTPLFLLLALPVSAEESGDAGLTRKFSGNVTIQALYFPNDATQREQYDGGNLSLSVEPELYLEWAGGKQSFTFTPFARLDQHDDERSHADIRELYWRRSAQAHEWRVGVRKVFWGVTESQHLVDVINQDDFIENIDGEDKLGQPMINLALIRDWGTLDLFVLPYFRERSFPGGEGRLRPALPVDSGHPQYESGREERHVDAALRWARSIGQWDVGLSYFDGTNRDPRLLVNPGAPRLVPDPSTLPPICLITPSLPQCQVTVFFPSAELVPRYDQVRQLGLDVQAIFGGWAWKLEAIRRESDFEKFTAIAAGFEYTYVGVFGTQIDVGMLGEYLWDSRGRLDEDSQQAFAQRRIQSGQGFTPAEAMALAGLQPKNFSPFEDDVFLGTRIAFNDVQSSDILAGVIVDRETHAVFGSIEANRRLSDHWKLSAETRFFSGLDELDPLYGFREDDYLLIDLIRYF
ncbi:MAG TPA: hypothetical protein VNJ47_01775 [Nevskiales bacterium]|nr:hypothetical protein [Nevskiales bacterium]